MNRILVIGGTGNVGREVISQLPSTGTHIRALARNPDAAHFPAQVEAVRGDLTLPETLDRCLDGIDSVFLVWQAPPVTVAPVLERIVKAARRVVFLSSPYTNPHPFFQAGQPNPVSAMHAEIERPIRASGLEWTFLRPGMIAANSRFWWASQIRAGDVVRWPYPDALTAPIHERDIGAVAVRALCDGGHAEAEYTLTGPQSLSQAEQVAAIGRAIGRSLRIEEIPPDEAPRELSASMPAFVAKMLLGAWAAAVGQPALVTSTVEEVTEAPARTFLDWAIDHAAEFQADPVK